MGATMRAEMVEVMRDQVQAIYHALTGRDLDEIDRGARGGDGHTVAPGPPGNGNGTWPGTESTTESEPDLEAIEQHFSELEALVRTLPGVAGRVPPFSFTPLLDAVETDRSEIILELAVPGVDRDDLTVVFDGDIVRVSGLRRGLSGAGASSYLSAEIPRGPFYRQVRLGLIPQAAPRVEVSRGIVRITISTKAATATEGSEHDTGRDG